MGQRLFGRRQNNIGDWLSPRALAFWSMDDGSLSSPTAGEWILFKHLIVFFARTYNTSKSFKAKI